MSTDGAESAGKWSNVSVRVPEDRLEQFWFVDTVRGFHCSGQFKLETIKPKRDQLYITFNAHMLQ